MEPESGYRSERGDLSGTKLGDYFMERVEDRARESGLSHRVEPEVLGGRGPNQLFQSPNLAIKSEEAIEPYGVNQTLGDSSHA